MAANFPGPYEVRIFYTTQLRQHVMKLNCTLTADPTPGDEFIDITAVTKGGGTRNLELGTLAVVTVVRPFLNTVTGEVNRAELWKYEPESFDSQFISVMDIALAGTAAGATLPATQSIWTFRTIGGGSMRFNILETDVAPAVTVYPPFAGRTNDVAVAMLSTNTIFHARDDTFPFAAVAYHPGQNERLFKRIYRP